MSRFIADVYANHGPDASCGYDVVRPLIGLERLSLTRASGNGTWPGLARLWSRRSPPSIMVEGFR